MFTMVGYIYQEQGEMQWKAYIYALGILFIRHNASVKKAY